MTEEELDRLFTRFYRAKNDTTSKVAGTGLGLYLTKFFIEAHNGRVVVESEKNQGTRFKIYLSIHMDQAVQSVGLTKQLLKQKKLKENADV